MTTTHYATFDGEVFRPEGSIPLEPNTRVRMTVEMDAEPIASESAPVTAEDDDPYLFLRILREANFDGPPDWSERLHYYLYGEGARSDE